jgi:hypothetical protein
LDPRPSVVEERKKSHLKTEIRNHEKKTKVARAINCLEQRSTREVCEGRNQRLWE